MLQRLWVGVALALLATSCSTGLADVDSTLPAANLDELVEVVGARVEQVRNLSFVALPTVTALPDAEFEAIVSSSSWLSAEERERIAEMRRQHEAFLRLLGMVEDDGSLQDLDASLARSVPARYLSETNEIVVRDYGLTPLMQGVLARYLAHALLVQNFPLLAEADGMSWTERAWIPFAIAEGDARRVENQYLALNLTLLEQADHSRLATDRALPPRTGLPEVLEKRLAGAEEIGEDFVRRTTNADRSEMLRDPPASSEMMLHTGSRDAPVPVQLAAVDVAGYQVFEEGVFGEQAFDTLFAAGLDDPVEQVRASDGWGGDAFRVYVADDDEAAAVFVVNLDSESDAGEFERAWQQLIDNRIAGTTFSEVSTNARTVMVVIATDSAVGGLLAESHKQ